MLFIHAQGVAILRIYRVTSSDVHRRHVGVNVAAGRLEQGTLNRARRIVGSRGLAVRLQANASAGRKCVRFKDRATARHYQCLLRCSARASNVLRRVYVKSRLINLNLLSNARNVHPRLISTLKDRPRVPRRQSANYRSNFRHVSSFRATFRLRHVTSTFLRSASNILRTFNEVSLMNTRERITGRRNALRATVSQDNVVGRLFRDRQRDHNITNRRVKDKVSGGRRVRPNAVRGANRNMVMHHGRNGLLTLLLRLCRPVHHSLAHVLRWVSDR